MKTYFQDNRLIVILLVWVATIFPTSLGVSQQVKSFDDRMPELRELFFAGFEGNDEALQQGMAIVEGTLKTDPDHPQALIWQASGWLFQSGQAFLRNDYNSGNTLFAKSLAQFSRGVSLAPGDISVLIPRAASLQSSARFVPHSPTRTMMLETVAGDYLKVLDVQTPYFESLSTHSRGELLGGISDALWQLGRRDEARVYLQRMVSELPNSLYATLAQRQLNEPDTAIQLTCQGCHH